MQLVVRLVAIHWMWTVLSMHAGGDWDARHASFAADITLSWYDDEYFEDDIVGSVCGVCELVYGEETLDENLKFIADALGGKGQPKDVIRDYFLNGFYTDHCSKYSVTGSGNVRFTGCLTVEKRTASRR